MVGDYVLRGDCWQYFGVFVLFFFCRVPDPCGSRSHRRGDEQPPERSGGPDYKPRHAAARAGGSGGRACAARRGRSPQRRRRVRSGSGSAAMAVPGQGAGAARRRGRLPLLLLGLAVSGGGRAPGRRGAVRGVSSFPGAGTGRGRWARPEELGESWERDGPLGLGAAAAPAGRTRCRSGRARHGTARHGWAPAALLPGVPLPSGVRCFHSLPFAKKNPAPRENPLRRAAVSPRGCGLEPRPAPAPGDSDRRALRSQVSRANRCRGGRGFLGAGSAAAKLPRSALCTCARVAVGSPAAPACASRQCGALHLSAFRTIWVCFTEINTKWNTPYLRETPRPTEMF